MQRAAGLRGGLKQLEAAAAASKPDALSQRWLGGSSASLSSSAIPCSPAVSLWRHALAAAAAVLPKIGSRSNSMASAVAHAAAEPAPAQPARPHAAQEDRAVQRVQTAVTAEYPAAGDGGAALTGAAGAVLAVPCSTAAKLLQRTEPEVWSFPVKRRRRRRSMRESEQEQLQQQQQAAALVAELLQKTGTEKGADSNSGSNGITGGGDSSSSRGGGAGNSSGGNRSGNQRTGAAGGVEQARSGSAKQAAEPGSRAARKRRGGPDRAAAAAQAAGDGAAQEVPDAAAVAVDSWSSEEAEAEAGVRAEADAASEASCPLPRAVILQDDAHPIRDADISRPAWFVLSRLRAAGHEAYIVGGTIRDLLLGGTPKDYDILTSAELHQSRRLFSRCHIVGRSFPVCQVYTEGTMLEVSSFSTHADSRLIPADASSHMIGRQKSKAGSGKQSQRWSREGATWAAARAENAARRDFTVNGLFYDPFSRLLFDSVGGVADCQARCLRTICPPGESFKKDPARILRGVRLAARAGLEVDSETAAAMEAHVASISQLPQGRLQMELGSLLGYGAAGASLALSWRLGLLDMLLPQQALYLRRHRVPRAPRTPFSPPSAPSSPSPPSGPSPRRGPKRNLLFELAAELDRHVHPQRPVDPSVWVALLAAPLVADQCAAALKRHNSKLRRFRREAAATEGAAAAPGEGVGEELEPEDALQPGSEGSLAGKGSDGSEGSGGQQEADEGEAEAEGQKQQQLRGWVSPEAAARQRYQERYNQIVTDVLDSMLQSLDSDTLNSLGRQARRHQEQLRQGGGRKGRNRRHPPGAQPEAAQQQEGQPQEEQQQQQQQKVGGGSEQRQQQQQVLMPCVLPRAAVDRAVVLLQLEADLRGRPELQVLLHRSGWPPAGGAAGGPAGAAAALDAADEGEQQPQQEQEHVGRHNEQHTLWQRLERASAALGGELQGGAGSAGGAPAAEQQQDAEGGAGGAARHYKKRHRHGRSLNAEERLVLGILSDPRFEFAARTALPP